jgi:DNA-binding NarL/FixJ family response regulator
MTLTRILLADDHAVVRAGIRNAIEDLPDIEIVGEVADGPTLHQAIADLQPQCVLIDVTMPQFDPVAEIRQIRLQYPRLKILVVSAYDDDIYVQGLLTIGVDGYHLKDQPLSDLRLAVSRVIAGEKWISSPLLSKLLSPAAAPVSPFQLSDRQRDILALLAQGLDNRAIAQHLDLSVKTIENHLTRLYRQLDVQSRLEAVHYVNEHPVILQGVRSVERGVDRDTAVTHSARATILVVDDNPRYRSQLRRTIAKAFPNGLVYEAENMREAVQQVKQVAPQIVFVDVVLGDEDGIRTTRRLKAAAPMTRIILISAYPDREFHRLGLEAGASAFVDKKDLDAATLQQMITDALG